MDYTKHYDRLMQQTPPEGYTEKHHVVPHCLGGTDRKSNVVTLSARQHFVAHWLLKKIYPNQPGLIYAFHMMFHPTSSNTRQTDWIHSRSRTYARLKEEMVVDIHARYVRDGHPFLGRKHSEATKQKIRDTKAKNPTVWTEEARKNLSRGRTGTKQPQSQKDKVAAANSAQWEVITPDGECIILTNLRQFCLARHLSQGNLCTFGHTKGYHATKLP